MSKYIIRQPDGKYALWSSIVDDFLCCDLTIDDVKEIYLEDAKDSIEDIIKRQLKSIDKIGKANYLAMTWDEALEFIEYARYPRP